MPEPIWYFAVGDEERGPVTEPQLRTLIGTENLSRDDLVWREGMEDWIPAGEVPGLFDKDAGAVSAEPPPARGGPEGRPKKDSEPVPPTVPRRLRLPRLPLSLTEPIDIFHHWAFVAQPLLLAGFFVMLLSRGCDSLAARDVARANARPTLAENAFQDKWQPEQAVLERQKRDLEKEKNGQGDAVGLANVEKQFRELEERKEREEKQLTQGAWLKLKAAARDAQLRSDAWSFWREGFFWIGTVLFALGLFPVVFSGEGPARWAALVLLAIVLGRLCFAAGS